MGFQVNPAQLIQMIQGGANPQQLMLSIMEDRIKNTPMGSNLISLARNNNGMEIEQFARNYTAQRGVDFDRAFCDFKNQLGIK